MILPNISQFAAAAKPLQSCPTLCDPIDVSPPGSPAPGILQARTLEWVTISFSNAWKWKSEGEVFQSCLTLSDPMGCSPLGSSIYGIFQARVLEWGAIAFPSFTVYIYVNLHGKPIGLVPSSKEKYTQISSEEISPKCFFLNKLEWYIMFI